MQPLNFSPPDSLSQLHPDFAPHIVAQVSTSVDCALFSLSLEAEVTPSLLFEIMAGMLREAEAAMARGTAVNPLSPSASGGASQPSASAVVATRDHDVGEAAMDVGVEGRRTSRGAGGGTGVWAGEVPAPRDAGGPVDWGSLLAGPSGSAGLGATRGGGPGDGGRGGGRGGQGRGQHHLAGMVKDRAVSVKGQRHQLRLCDVWTGITQWIHNLKWEVQRAAPPCAGGRHNPRDVLCVFPLPLPLLLPKAPSPSPSPPSSAWSEGGPFAYQEAASSAAMVEELHSELRGILMSARCGEGGREGRNGWSGVAGSVCRK